MKPPMDQHLEFMEQQLSPTDHMVNLFYLAKNSYELNDNYSGLPLGFDAVQEGEYYSVARKESINKRYRVTDQPDTVFTNIMLIDSSEVHHSRDVYMFLFVLADFGGVQLILTVIVAFITEFANDRKSMHSILKKFFYIKARDPTMLDPAGKNTTMANDIYKWKF
jgi:hypothetical protein